MTSDVKYYISACVTSVLAYMHGTLTPLNPFLPEQVNRSSPRREIPRILWNPKGHYIRQQPATWFYPEPDDSCINRQAAYLCVKVLIFSSNLPVLMFLYFKRPLSFGLLYQNPLCVSLPLCVLHALPNILTSENHEALHCVFLSRLMNFVSLRFKYYPGHPSHVLPMAFP